jgi:N-acetylmuramoyl-L-alanine amidase
MSRRAVIALIGALGVIAIALVASSSGATHHAAPAAPAATIVAGATPTIVAATSTSIRTTTVAPTTTTTSASTTVPRSTTAPATSATRSSTTMTPQPVVVQTAGLGSLRGVTVAIDAGHNGGNAAHAAEIARPIWIGTQYRACDTTGTQGADGYPEYAYNLDVALRLQAVLEAAGAQVVMTRTSNAGWGPCVDERAAIGNRAHATVAISIHADGGPAGGRGFHVNMPALIPGYTDDIYGASHRLGVDVRDAMATTGMPTATYIGSAGLIERRDFGGLNLSDVPKVLLETGNMQNGTDLALLESAAFRQREAQVIAAALARFVAGG